jgi:hypothetical protein
VALQRKPRSLRALFLLFLPKAYAESNSRLVEGTGFFPPFHYGKGLGGGFTKKTKVAPRPIFSFCSKANADQEQLLCFFKE